MSLIDDWEMAHKLDNQHTPDWFHFKNLCAARIRELSTMVHISSISYVIAYNIYEQYERWVKSRTDDNNTICNFKNWCKQEMSEKGIN